MRFAIGLAVAVVLAMAGAAQARSPEALLARFQPVTVFHPAEEFRPVPVEAFLRDSNLEAATGPGTWVVADPAPFADSLPTASPPAWRLDQRDCLASAPLGDLPCDAAGAADEPGRLVYGRVARIGQRIVLQYWLFYYENVYRYPYLPPGSIWQSHEGDWESVTVVLSASPLQPLVAGYSRHCSGEARPWAATARRNGHPIVYVALGSHANYFERGRHEVERRCLRPEVIAGFRRAGLPLPADVAVAGPAGGPAILGLAEGFAVQRVGRARPGWIRFPGFWGELEYWGAPPPIGIIPVGPSPLGPVQHAVWRRPLATLARWRAAGPAAGCATPGWARPAPARTSCRRAPPSRGGPPARRPARRRPRGRRR